VNAKFRRWLDETLKPMGLVETALRKALGG
jgi:hypothetical protein